MDQDNPNYFDDHVASSGAEPNSKSFFLFKKRSSASRATPIKSSTPAMINKRSGSFKGLLRSRSNSNSSTTPKAAHYSRDYNALDAGSFSGNDDVFYSNTITPKCNDAQNDKGNREHRCGSEIELRRHSIGTFMMKENFRFGSISDEVPRTIAPKAPSFALNCNDMCGNAADAAGDILFVLAKHSEQALVWVNHLKTCFDKITKQRGRQPFKFLHFKVDGAQITQQFVQMCKSTKLQIVIICPTLLSFSSVYLYSTFKQVLKPDCVLGMLLDVAENHMAEIHESTFPGYHKWRISSPRDVGDHDQAFVNELLGMAIDILGRVMRQQLLSSEIGNAVSEQKPQPTAHSSSAHHDTFTLFPRKVKVGQNKIIIILVEHLMKDDWIKIKIEMSNETIEITNVKRRNPYTIQFNIPDACLEISMMIGVRVEKNNIDLGCRPLKCESRLRELEQILKSQTSPVEFLCQSVGIASADRDRLDSLLLQSFQKNVPTNFHLLNSVESASGLKSLRESHPEEYPTLLHFSAHWGLERLSLQLMDCPGGDVACGLRNFAGRTPMDLADIAGHMKLANSFRNFSQMHEFTTMYHYFKGISEASPDKIIIQPKMAHSPNTCNLVRHHQSEGYMKMNGSGSDIESSQNETFSSVSNLNYLNFEATGHGQDEVDLAIDKKKQAEKDKEILNNLNSDIDHDAREQEILFNELKITEPMYFESSDVNKSDAFSQECSNLLESCNVSDVNDFDYLVQPSNLPVRKIDTVESDYLVQPSNIPVHEYTNLEIGRDWHDVQEAGRDLSHLRLSFKKKDSESSGTSKDRGLQRQESNTSKKSVDDELLEIIADFKNNVFTIQEVESLVESWKSRNDVQKCFKDKQEQLQKMREEYERIQQQMKEKLKRPTPFERMKKMFSRNKSTTNTKDTQSSSGPSDICEDIKFSMMPSTSQSNRPNSSSSLHSISSNSSGISSSNSSEERKCVTKNRAGSSMEDYMIPPSPRPLNPVLENRPISNAHDSDEHYTAFPSNVPVAVQQQMSDYVNTSAMLNSIDENNETETILQSINVQRQNVSYSQLDIVRPSMSSFK